MEAGIHQRSAHPHGVHRAVDSPEIGSHDAKVINLDPGGWYQATWIKVRFSYPRAVCTKSRLPYTHGKGPSQFEMWRPPYPRLVGTRVERSPRSILSYRHITCRSRRHQLGRSLQPCARYSVRAHVDPFLASG